jgi:hypothetical protein
MTEPSPSKPMPVFEFLEGKADGSERSIDKVLTFDDTALERNHGLIQWLFPLPEPSRAQPSSPILPPMRSKQFEPVQKPNPTSIELPRG